MIAIVIASAQFKSAHAAMVFDGARAMPKVHDPIVAFSAGAIPGGFHVDTVALKRGLNTASFHYLSAPLSTSVLASAATPSVATWATPGDRLNGDPVHIVESTRAPVPTGAVMLVSGILVLASLLTRGRAMTKRQAVFVTS
jgi:hypothetical protein